MNKSGVIGLDIGGTKTLLALFDEKFRVLKEIKMKTHPEKDDRAFTNSLRSAIDEIRDKAKKERLSIIAVGAGCAGHIDQQNGTVKQGPNIPFLKGYPLRRRLSKFTGVNAVLANDVHAGLYGESKLGSAVGARNAIAIFIGTGVGGALLLEGKLYLGSDGMAGNIGNYLLHPIGPLAGSDREGTVDDLVSRTAIAAEAAALAAKQWAPYLSKTVGTDIAEIKSGSLADAIKAGDRSIEKLVRTRTRIMGVVLSNFVDFFNPDMVILGGGLVDAMPSLVRQEVEKGIRSNSSVQGLQNLKVVTAKLRQHAVTAGAAKMAVDALAMNPVASSS